MSNTLGITLARGGSKGVKDKNIRTVGGKPLLAWTIQQAQEAKKLDHYIVSTDSPSIAAVAREWGAEVIFRPAYLATDEAPSIGALIHGLDVAENLFSMEFDVLADIRNTNPTKLPSDIDGAIEKLIRTGADCVAGCTKLEDHHPSRIKMIVEDRLVDVWPEPEGGNRQDLAPDCYIRNGSIYAVRTAALREGVFFLGGVTRPWLMPLERSVNIDTEQDMLVCEMLLTAAK